MKANYENQIEEQKVNGSFNLSLYDLNKQVIAQLPDLTEEQLQDKKAMIADYVDGYSNYFMLLGREINYYTLFIRNLGIHPTVQDEVVECLKYLGKVKAIDLNEDKTGIEAWVVLPDGTATMLMFFDYAGGVILCQ